MRISGSLMLIVLICGCSSEQVPLRNDITETKSSAAVYQPAWESLKKHEDPEWFKDAKFGIYTHWGPYSVPAFGNEWYPRWMYVDRDHRRRGNYYEFHKQTYGDPVEFGYKDLVPMFKAEKFNAHEWAELFAQAGAKFAGPVAEHHDGFAMWDSAVTEWDAGEKGPQRDLVGELEKAIKKRGMKFITSFHHARKWWYYEESYKLADTVDTRDPRYAGVGKIYPPVHDIDDPPTKEYMKEWKDKIIEVIDKYQPDLLWFDGGLDRENFWRSSREEFQQYKKDFLAYYYNQSEQWDRQVGVTYKHEDLPKGTAILDIERGRMGGLTDYIWLTDTAIDMKSWSHVKNPDYKSVNTLVDVLVDIVSKNGCLLLNVGPRADGSIPREAQDLLLGIGKWLKVNGEAIYGTRPWIKYGEGPARPEGGQFKEQKDSIYGPEDIRFTTKKNVLYAICLDWPGRQVKIESLGSDTKIAPGGIKAVRLVGRKGKLKWIRNQQALVVNLPNKKPCQHAFVIKIICKGKV